MIKMIIDGTDLILGRLSTFVAKQALLGESIQIVNCDKVVITGDKKRLTEKFKQKKDRGIPAKGPHYPRMADRIVRRSIRGMLPYKKDKGDAAYRKVMCYVGIPEELQNKKLETIKEANISKVPNLKFTKLAEISKFLGAK